MYRLKFPFYPGLIPVLLLTLASPGAAASDGDLDQLEQWLLGVQTLQGSFVQTLTRDGDIQSQSRGTMQLSRPGLFRWHYTEPAELLVVSDGRQVYNYDVELESVTVIPQQQALTGSPIALLSGEKKISDGFVATGRWQAGEVAWTELEPRDTGSDFSLIRLGLEDERLVAMELHDQLGQVTRVEFSSVDLNLPLAAGLFRFEIPQGVDVIESGEAAP